MAVFDGALTKFTETRTTQTVVCKQYRPILFTDHSLSLRPSGLEAVFPAGPLSKPGTVRAGDKGRAGEGPENNGPRTKPKALFSVKEGVATG